MKYLKTMKTRGPYQGMIPLAALVISMTLFLAGCSGKSSASSTAPGNAAAPSDTSLNGNAPPAVAPEQNVQEQLVIPEGRVLSVRLLESISSRSASAGELFDAELAAPVIVDGRTVLPSHTPLRGRIVSARSSGRLRHPGYLRLTLDSVKAPNGNWVAIRTTSVRAQGKSHKNRNLALIGGGGGLGAAIGAIAGGGKGAAIGVLSGAGAGTVGAYVTGKKDVTFSAEHRLSFRTVQETVIG